MSSVATEFIVDGAHRYNQRGPLRWIMSHLVRYPLFPLIVVVTTVGSNIAYGQIQVLVGRGFDTISEVGWTLAQLAVVALGVLGAAMTQGLTGLGRNFAVEFMAQHIEKDSREELYGSLLGKSQSFHGRQKVGDIMARATGDVKALNGMVSPGLMLIFDSAMALVVPVVMIGIIDASLLLVPLIFTALLTITVYDYNRRLQPVSIGQRETYGKMSAELAETVSGIEVVKANVRERYELDKFLGNARAFREFFVKQGIIQARYLPMLMFAICWGGALFHGLWLWRQGSVTLGQVVAFMGLFGTLRFATFISIFSFNLVQMGLAGGRRILSMIKETTDLDENRSGRASDTRGAVTFENVSFAYNGTAVLEDMSFHVEPGETVAIVGRTGSGKSTLTRLINRIFDVSSGRVLIDGVDVRDWSLERLRSQISSIDQDVFLFSRSLKDNIAFGHEEASDGLVEQAAREAQADGFIRSFPQGYDTVIGERGVTLSGGQRQRIAIARAFITDPKILILDDSTSAIDSTTEDEIQQAMRRISSNRTTFVITHRLSQIRWADRILVLDGGRLADGGTHDELMNRSPDYRRIFARYN